MAESKLVGTDFAEQCRIAGRILREDHERNFERDQNIAAEREAKQSTGKHEYFLVVERLKNGLTQVTTIEEWPMVGRLSAIGRNYDSAVVELRMGFATELVQKGLLPDIDTARRYVCRADFRPSLADVR